MEVVINRCFGGYCLSREAYEFLGIDWDGHGNAYKDDRTNKDLVGCVKELGSKADGIGAFLIVTEIPGYMSWEISNYDGKEFIQETHRSWGV